MWSINCLSNIAILVPDTEYVVEFPSRNVENYIQQSTPVPSLVNFTVSFWMKKVVYSKMAIFSYTTSEETNAIRVLIGLLGSVNLYVMSG